MNNSRRKEIYAIINQLEKAKGTEEIENIISDIESVLFDEECARDNIPENLQESERYEMSDEACGNLESAIDALNDIEDDDIKAGISDAVDYLNDAAM